MSMDNVFTRQNLKLKKSISKNIVLSKLNHKVHSCPLEQFLKENFLRIPQYKHLKPYLVFFHDLQVLPILGRKCQPLTEEKNLI